MTRLRSKSRIGIMQVFPYWMWHWTQGGEDLFQLSREERAIFVLLVQEASKG